MNAVLQPQPRHILRTLRLGDLDAVLAVESQAYRIPWTRGNFIDSLAAGYLARVLVAADESLVGYFVAMAGVDEMHLLNLTVAPMVQRQGHALAMLDAVEDLCRTHRLPTLWLEVRAGNESARALYLRRGFAEVGLRPGYYPAAFAQREDAVVMTIAIRPEAPHALD